MFSIKPWGKDYGRGTRDKKTSFLSSRCDNDGRNRLLLLLLLILLSFLKLLLRSISIFSEQDFFEGKSEIRIKHGVYNRIEQAVEISEPADDARQDHRVFAIFAAERPHEGEDEEGQPANDERPRDDR